MSKNSQVKKLQELVYELNAGLAMTRNVITVSPELPMRELRDILRKNKISGVPVMEDGALVGIVSIEDFINWLADDRSDCCVGDRMSTKVVTAYTDEPLVHVVSRLEETGFGRLPVIDRSTEVLAGIITKGDIIERLLHKLEVDYQEEEIRQYRASQFFDDVAANGTRLSFYYPIRKRKIEDGGEVASALKKTLRRLGMHPALVRRAAIVTYEAEMNVIIYAEEGSLSVSVDRTSLALRIEDTGPGIADVERAMHPGFSTAPEWVRELGFGAGMGLSNIKNCADTLRITSKVGTGTTLETTFEME